MRRPDNVTLSARVRFRSLLKKGTDYSAPKRKHLIRGAVFGVDRAVCPFFNKLLSVFSAASYGPMRNNGSCMADSEPKLPPPDPDPQIFPQPGPVPAPEPEEPDPDVNDPMPEPLPA
jgi:hypothetical protein